MNPATMDEMRQREVEAAALLVQLSAVHAAAVMDLLAALAADLLEVSAGEARALFAANDIRQAMQVRMRHAAQAARLMIEAAQRLAEAGNAARVGFSRLLTERLAAGSHESMDAFQAYFRVLPAADANVLAALRLTTDRSGRILCEIDDMMADAVSPAAGIVVQRRRSAAKNPRGDQAPVPPAVGVSGHEPSGAHA